MFTKKELTQMFGATAIGGTALFGVTALVPAPEAAALVAEHETEAVCDNALASGDTDVVASEHATLASAECMFVGCGGIF